MWSVKFYKRVYQLLKLVTAASSEMEARVVMNVTWQYENNFSGIDGGVPTGVFISHFL